MKTKEEFERIQQDISSLTDSEFRRLLDKVDIGYSEEDYDREILMTDLMESISNECERCPTLSSVEKAIAEIKDSRD